MSSIFIFDHEEESSSKLNIDELYDKRQRRDLKQLSIFNKLLNRIHKRIQYTAKSKQAETFIWFIVPEYIVGEPIYDKGDCIGYLVSQLEKNGFFVKYVHPNTVFVSWHTWVPSYVRNEIKKKLGVSLDEKGNIIEKKTTEEMDNSNPDTQMFITDREKITQSNTSSNSSQKQYTPIKNYKPTGNLVYSPDVLEKLEKKISFNI
jgi:hypothetical protein